MSTTEKKSFLENVYQNIYSEIAIKANFPFSHYKTMDNGNLVAIAMKVHNQQQ